MNRIPVAISAVVALLLLAFSIRTVLADAPPTASAIHMAGDAEVQGTQRQPVLSLRADATDGSGWQLVAALIPDTSRRQNETRATRLTGQFT